MGGGGVASPQDAISAIFANPAAMCFGPFCPGSSVDFAGTYFDPTVKGRATNFFPPPAPSTLEGESELNPFMVPAIGITTPINEKMRFGIGMYGVSGLGTDYKGTQLSPLYTQLQVMKFAPNLAYLITPNFSVGLSAEVVWQNLDLGQGSAHGYTLGAQIGALYHLGMFNFGLSYTTPEKVKHKNVANFDASLGSLTYDDLELESPQTVKMGVSFEPNTSWLFEFNTRWYNWSDAAGYEDFNWDDQWVFAIGAQWKPAEKWALRLGYNYGQNPVNEDNNFNPFGVTNVQGTPVPTAEYEFLRVVGFPAIAEQHYTAGVGYRLTDAMAINLSVMFSPEETFSESTNGGVTVIEAKLKEWSTTFGLTWYF
jgi:long-chain fatty acid transport protein